MLWNTERNNMKICVLGNQSRTVYLFWRVLILQLIAAGHKVLCLAPSGDTAMDNSLRKLGAQVQHYRLDRKGVNPLRDIVTFLNLKQIFKREHPICSLLQP